jgi:hypothetical protein
MKKLRIIFLMVIIVGTGVVWLKDANCFGSQYWSGAKSTAASLDSDTDPCGLTDGSQAGDWRLPTMEEWEEFVCTQYYRPAVCNTEGTGQWSESDPFNDISRGMGVDYWTGTGSPNSVWIMNVTGGILWNHPDTVTCLVWPVRDPL